MTEPVTLGPLARGAARLALAAVVVAFVVAAVVVGRYALRATGVLVPPSPSPSALSYEERRGWVSAAPERDPEAYYFRLQVDRSHARVTVTANGLPLHTLGTSLTNDYGRDVALAPGLVSGRNTVALVVTPYISGSRLGYDVGSAEVWGWVSRGKGRLAEVPPGAVRAARAAWEAELAARWPGWAAAEDSLRRADGARWAAEAAARTPEEAVAGRGGAIAAARAWADANPVVVGASFVRPGGAAPSDGQPAFDRTLREAAVIGGTPTDSARLRDYAIHLRDLNVRADTSALFSAMETVYAHGFQWGGGEKIGQDSLSFMRGARRWVVFDDLVPFERKDVRLRSWAGGRVWELYRDGTSGLLEPGDDSAYRKIFVGEADGELRVVR